MREVWSIDLFHGSSPFDLKPLETEKEPALTADRVTDVEAGFVCDPFLVRRATEWFLFFEVWNLARSLGEVGLATSRDGLEWAYQGVVLREPFHLSYPHVFSWRGEYYMTPETLGAETVRLYRASSFPFEWTRDTDLLPGVWADPTPFRSEGSWWLLGCPAPEASDTLCLFFSDNLRGPWEPHPASPLVAGDPRLARPAGRVVRWQGRPIRLAQDCVPHYGSRVRAFCIEELTRSSYRESESSESPVLKGGWAFWNRRGMHHVDAMEIEEGRWVACVDGYRMEVG